VSPDDLRQHRGLGLQIEDVELVRAEQRALAVLEEPVPELLDRDRGPLVPALEEDVDHLAEGADGLLRETGSHLIEDPAHGFLEAVGRRDDAVHERRKGLFCVAAREQASGLQLVGVRADSRAKCVPVLGGSDHDRGLAGAKAGVEELADRRGQLVELRVDLHSVLGRRSALEERFPAHLGHNVPEARRDIPDL
jgi:hypothetical protein